MTLFIDTDDTRVEQSVKHTGCQAIVETLIQSEDEGDYTSASEEEIAAEPRKTRAFGQPFRKIVRQSKGGWNCKKQGMSDEKVTGRKILTQYMSYKATDT